MRGQKFSGRLACWLAHRFLLRPEAAIASGCPRPYSLWCGNRWASGHRPAVLSPEDSSPKARQSSPGEVVEAQTVVMLCIHGQAPFQGFRASRYTRLECSQAPMKARTGRSTISEGLKLYLQQVEQCRALCAGADEEPARAHVYPHQPITGRGLRMLTAATILGQMTPDLHQSPSIVKPSIFCFRTSPTKIGSCAMPTDAMAGFAGGDVTLMPDSESVCRLPIEPAHSKSSIEGRMSGFESLTKLVSRNGHTHGWHVVTSPQHHGDLLGHQWY